MQLGSMKKYGVKIILFDWDREDFQKTFAELPALTVGRVITGMTSPKSYFLHSNSCTGQTKQNNPNKPTSKESPKDKLSFDML